MKQLQINPTNEFNLLRHYSKINEDYSKTLLGQEYFFHNHSTGHFEKGIVTDEAITNALETKNSKFFNNIPGLNTPNELLNLIKDKFDSFKPEEIKWEGSKKFFSFLIEYPEPVGIKNLIPIESLTDEEKTRVKTLPRSNKVGETGIMIKTIEGIEAKPLETIEIGLQDSEELTFYLVNAYPGDMEVTPGFPSDRQSKEEYEKSIEYWDTHVFIV